MVRKMSILFAATFFMVFCFGQTPRVDTLVKFNYYPAFHNPSQLKLFEENGISKAILLTYSTEQKGEKVDTVIKTIPDEVYLRYSKFLQTYHFPGFIDNKYPDTSKNYNQGFDGITVVGVYYHDTSKKLFRFWSPYHDAASMTLLKMTLKDIESYLRTNENKRYVKWLKKYAK